MLKRIVDRNKYLLITLLSAVVILIIWEVTARILDKDYLLPGVTAVIGEFVALWGKKTFYVNLGNTILRCVVGFVCAYILGFGLGIIGGRHAAVGAILRPITSFLKTTPIMALTLLLLIWFKSNATPMIIGFILVFPLVYATISDSVAAIDPKMKQVATVYDISAQEKIRYVYFPEIAPVAFSLSMTTFAMNVKAVISAEILSYTYHSLGLSMYIAKSHVFEDTALLFAYVFVAIFISAVFELIMSLVKKRVCAHFL